MSTNGAVVERGEVVSSGQWGVRRFSLPAGSQVHYDKVRLESGFVYYRVYNPAGPGYATVDPDDFGRSFFPPAAAEGVYDDSDEDPEDTPGSADVVEDVEADEEEEEPCT